MAKFPTAQEIRWAAADPEYYHDLRAKVTGVDAKQRFDSLVRIEFADAGRQVATPQGEPLTYVEQRVLDFAATKLPRFRKPGSAEQGIRYEFGFSATRYYQVLGSLIDRPEAREYAPAVVNRLQARRTAARARRCTAGLGRAA